MKAPKKVAILAKQSSMPAIQSIQQIEKWCAQHHIALVLDDQLQETKMMATYLPRAQLCAGADLLFVLGGDGTLLIGARAAVMHDCAVLGVNLGSLGFLTAIRPDALGSMLTQIQHGVEVEQRVVLQAVLKRNQQVVGSWVAVNDVVINKGALARIINLSAYIDGKMITNYNSDGLIIATPTGSTAYSLSAGGPIVEPTMHCVVVTPICAHALTNRPLILHTIRQLTFKLDDSNGRVFLTIDGQEGMELQEGDEVAVDYLPKKLQLVKSPSKSYFEVLRTKLKWGERV